jgi:hypothetical protein
LLAAQDTEEKENVIPSQASQEDVRGSGKKRPGCVLSSECWSLRPSVVCAVATRIADSDSDDGEKDETIAKKKLEVPYANCIQDQHLI